MQQQQDKVEKMKGYEQQVKTGQDFDCHPILYLILRSRNIIRMNPDMMVFILEIVHIIARIGGYVINLDDYKLVGTH